MRVGGAGGGVEDGDAVVADGGGDDVLVGLEDGDDGDGREEGLAALDVPRPKVSTVLVYLPLVLTRSTPVPLR